MRALVLSSGGSFGAYQAGAWLALEEMKWRPDLVVGTSIGAVNGFAISRGCRGGELLHLWRQLPREIHASFGDPARARVWADTGLFRSWVREVYSRYRTRPTVHAFRITVTTVPHCAIQVIRGEEISGQHLMATCSVLGCLWPVRLNGGFCVDGGTFCHLPLRPAIDDGATEVVAVDSMAVHPWPPVRRVLRAAARIGNIVRGDDWDPDPEQLARVCLRRIERHERLGSLRQCFHWDRSFVDSLIEKGYRDAWSGLTPPEKKAAAHGTAPPFTTSN